MNDFYLYALFFLLGGLSMDMIFDYPLLEYIYWGLNHVTTSNMTISLFLRNNTEFALALEEFSYKKNVNLNLTRAFHNSHRYYQQTMQSMVAAYVFPFCVIVVVVGMLRHYRHYKTHRSLFCIILTVISILIYVLLEGNIEKELPYLENEYPRIRELCIKAALGHLLLFIMITLGIILLLLDKSFQPKFKSKVQ